MNLIGHGFCTCFFFSELYCGGSLLFFTLLPLESMDDSLCFKIFGQFGHFLGLTRTSKKQVYNIINISYHWYQWDPIFMTFWLIRVIRCDQSKNLNISKYEWTENVYNSSRMWNWIWFQMFRTVNESCQNIKSLFYFIFF